MTSSWSSAELDEDSSSMGREGGRLIDFTPDTGWVIASSNKSSHCISLWEQTAEADPAAGCGSASCLPFPGLCRIHPGTTAWALGLPKQSQGCAGCAECAECAAPWLGTASPPRGSKAVELVKGSLTKAWQVLLMFCKFWWPPQGLCLHCFSQ